MVEDRWVLGMGYCLYFTKNGIFCLKKGISPGIFSSFLYMGFTSLAFIVVVNVACDVFTALQSITTTFSTIYMYYAEDLQPGGWRIFGSWLFLRKV